MKKYISILVLALACQLHAQLPDSIISESTRLYFGERAFCDYTITHNEEVYELFYLEEDCSTVIHYNYVKKTGQVVLNKSTTKHRYLPVKFFDFNFVEYPSYEFKTNEPDKKEKDNFEQVEEMVKNKLNPNVVRL